MDRGWYLRFVTVVVAAVAAWCALWPSIDQWVPAPAIVKEYFTGRISPGLDIRGGLRLMYEVDIDEAIRNRRDRLAESLLTRMGVELEMIDDDEPPTREELNEIRARVKIQRVEDHEIRITVNKAADLNVIDREFLDTYYQGLRQVSRSEKQITFAMRDEELEELQKTAIEQTVRTISNRIDELQIRETSVIGRPGSNDIIVEIPGASDEMFDRIRSIISRTARLEFKVLDDDNAASFVDGLTLPEGIEVDSEIVSAGEANPQVVSKFLVAKGEGSRQRLSDFIASLDIADDHELAVGRVDSGGDDPSWRTYYLFSDTDVTGEDIKDAFVTFDSQEQGKPVVAVHFDSSGATRFEAMTGANVKRRMAIALDGRVESAPVIQTRIGGGRAQITLGSYQGYNKLLSEANELVIVLRAGALPAPIRPANEQLIGPTLGHDSVAKGAEGALVGVLLVILFMAFYYQVGGIVADGMVILNLLFLMAIMAAFEATLTLPGVAAIALTVGMAVDANVLITERIREELRLGKSPRSAVDQGFRRAFWSIFDSQLTTFIAGVVLFQYGTGPIKGFAVMLMIGIGTSLFTGIFCSKVFLDWIVRGLRVQRLRVG